MEKEIYNKIIEHLKKYKTEVLGILESGIWKETGESYPHILPEDMSIANIINKGYQEKINELIDDDDKHWGFNHLNSSQIMTLNLFGPLVITNNTNIIDRLLNINNQTKFEYCEDKTDGTIFDFFISKEKIYFEVKYTENKFSEASGSNKDYYHRKYSNVYEERLMNITNDISEGDFFYNYQLWRNIIYSANGIVVFVLPSFRKDLIETVESVRQKTNFPNNIRLLMVDDIVDKAIEIEELKEHYIEFKAKYLNIDF